MTRGSRAAAGGAEPGSTAWRTAGRACAVVGWICWVVMQVAAGDPFPPDISISQYGLGGAGWVFSLWALSLAISPLLLLKYRPVPEAARPLLLVGLAGAVVTALVRTDEGGLQVSLTAKLHMVGAVVALVMIPLGILFAMMHAPRPWWRFAVGLALTTAAVGVLVLASAAGFDTAGRGSAASWALWQGVLGVLEMVLVGTYALAVTSVDPPSARRGTGPPVQSAIQ